MSNELREAAYLAMIDAAEEGEDGELTPESKRKIEAIASLSEEQLASIAVADEKTFRTKVLKAPQSQDKVIAVDFNRTLAQGAGPGDFGEPTEGAAEAMQTLKDRGYTVCINSVVGDVEKLRTWLDEKGIVYDYVNESPAQPEDSNPGKMNAAAYVDDRAIPYRGNWDETLEDLFSSGVLKKRIVIGRPGTMTLSEKNGYVRKRLAGKVVSPSVVVSKGLRFKAEHRQKDDDYSLVTFADEDDANLAAEQMPDVGWRFERIDSKTLKVYFKP